MTETPTVDTAREKILANRKAQPYGFAMIASIRSKVLKRYWTRGDDSGLHAEWRGKIKRAMGVLNEATAPTDMDLSGYGFHALTGDMQGRFAVSIFHNWRLTFGWSGDDAIDVDLEDYHG